MVLHLVPLVVAFADEDMWGQQGTAQGEGSQTHMSMVHSNTIHIHIEQRSGTHVHNSQEHISAGHSHTMNTVS